MPAIFNHKRWSIGWATAAIISNINQIAGCFAATMQELDARIVGRTESERGQAKVEKFWIKMYKCYDNQQQHIRVNNEHGNGNV